MKESKTNQLPINLLEKGNIKYKKKYFHQNKHKQMKINPIIK